jgi:hypothetical protein
VEKWRGFRCIGQDVLQLFLASLELDHLGVYSLGGPAFEDQVRQCVELTVDSLDL